MYSIPMHGAGGDGAADAAAAGEGREGGDDGRRDVFCS